MKKKEEKKEAPGVENFWKKLVDTYFQFFKDHFRDSDGFRLSPDWSPQKIGMEAGALKKIIIFLRQIAEGKKTDWAEDYAVNQLNLFLEKAYNDPFLKKNFYCALLNKKKIDILISTYNPGLVKKILEIWYFEFPNYTRDVDKDKAAAEIIIGFLKQQYILASAEFTEVSLLGSIRLIFQTVKEDEFWSKKSLKSISNNLQEFINKIKNEKQQRERGGINRGSNSSQRAFSTSDSKIAALRNWGVKTTGSSEANKNS